MPRTELNVLPPLFSSWQEWRATYDAYVAEYEDDGDERQLVLNLKRLGYQNAVLDEELKFITNETLCTRLS